MARIKICGITNWADAQLAVDSGADALGFNFYPKSPRRIRISRAKAIVRKLPRRIARVGVFVNSPREGILRTARAVGLDSLQLHGEESPRFVRALAKEYPVIKAFRVKPGFRVSELKRYGDASAFLLDGFDAAARGGTGKPFDWKLARAAKHYGLVILAGGLRPGNVSRAIRSVEPFAVDVASGIEARPGKKDAKRLRAFVVAANSARRKSA